MNKLDAAGTLSLGDLYHNRGLNELSLASYQQALAKKQKLSLSRYARAAKALINRGSYGAGFKYLEEIQVSNDTLRNMISSLNEISLGSKITGAGDGGCIIALVKDDNMDKVPALLGKDKECFSAKIDTKGVVRSTIEE